MEYERYELTQPLYSSVNVLRMGDWLVDTGHVASTSRDTLRALMNDELEGIRRVIHTHPHIDHVGGSQTIGALADLPHLVPEGTIEILYDYSDYLECAHEEMTTILAGFTEAERTWPEYFPDVTFTEEQIDVRRELADGDVVEVAGTDLEVVWTPGHAEPHVAFWESTTETLLTGDLVDPSGQFQYGPLLGDVGAYEASLRRIKRLEPSVLVPMHGPPMTDPQRRIREALANVENTRERIRRFTDDRVPYFARTFVNDELGVTGPRAPLLTLVIYEYLRHLDDRGELSTKLTNEGVRVT